MSVGCSAVSVSLQPCRLGLSYAIRSGNNVLPTRDFCDVVLPDKLLPTFRSVTVLRSSSESGSPRSFYTLRVLQLLAPEHKEIATFRNVENCSPIADCRFAEGLRFHFPVTFDDV
jgi:hypothetical protein